MTAFATKPLDEATWPDFADLVERNNGVWGGCWCMGFHPEGLGRSPEQHRANKHRRVCDGEAHAALVFHDGRCVGWCQFGPTDELPRIKSRRAYEADLVELPDWRITCFFVESSSRRSGVADAALSGALDEIERLGGGTVESYPEDIEGRKVSNSFLHNGTLAMFEQHGFERQRKIAKHRWVVSRVV